MHKCTRLRIRSVTAEIYTFDPDSFTSKERFVEICSSRRTTDITRRASTQANIEKALTFPRSHVRRCLAQNCGDIEECANLANETLVYLREHRRIERRIKRLQPCTHLIEVWRAPVKMAQPLPMFPLPSKIGNYGLDDCLIVPAFRENRNTQPMRIAPLVFYDIAIAPVAARVLHGIKKIEFIYRCRHIEETFPRNIARLLNRDALHLLCLWQSAQKSNFSLHRATRILPSVFRFFRLTRREWLLALAFGLALLVFLGVHAWTTSRWYTQFSSDEAMLGLMAKHMMEGKGFPVYFYGNQYGGSLPSLFAVPFLWFFGTNVLSLHLSVIAVLGLFALVQLIWTRRHFGNGVAIMSLLILAFPSYTLLSFLTVISTRISTYLLLWMCALLLCEANGMRLWLRASLFGLCFGLCFWTQPLTLHYFMAIGIVWILQSEEWANLRKRFPIPDWEWVLIFFAGLFGGPALVFAGFASLLLIPVALIVIGAFSVSARKKELLVATGMIVLGALIGTAPQWILWLKEGIGLSQPYFPSFPTWERLSKLAQYTFPSLWGIRPIRDLPHHPLSFRISSIFVAFIVPAALLHFLWKQRKDVGDFVRLRHLTQTTAPSILLLVLFALPLIAQLGMDGDEGTVRYLAPAWQASGIIVALFFVRSWEKWKILGLALAALWFFHMAYGNMNFMRQAWGSKVHDMDQVHALTAYLQEHDATHGYADFWIAYALDYLSEEELTLVYYDTYVRYAPYNTAIAAAKKQAYIFRPEWNPMKEGMKLETMIAGMRENMHHRGGIPEPIFDELKKKRVLSRKKVAIWDVWILENPDAK